MEQALIAIETADEDQLDTIIVAVNARRRALRSMAAARSLAELSVGDHVELDGLSPKYLNGCTGVLEGKSGTKITVRLDDEFRNSRARSRFGDTLVCPASCVKIKESA